MIGEIHYIFKGVEIFANGLKQNDNKDIENILFFFKK